MDTNGLQEKWEGAENGQWGAGGARGQKCSETNYYVCSTGQCGFERLRHTVPAIQNEAFLANTGELRNSSHILTDLGGQPIRMSGKGMLNVSGMLRFHLGKVGGNINASREGTSAPRLGSRTTRLMRTCGEHTPKPAAVSMHKT